MDVRRILEYRVQKLTEQESSIGNISKSFLSNKIFV